MASAEELFARFVARGDSEALAAVFDELAPQLLRLALHLCRDESLAEDLLQATFLVAIEKARRFDPARSLEAWLVGILQRKAKGLGRAVPRAPAARERPEPHPLEHVAGREALASVEKALARLAEPYREPLRLRLVDGLSASEIATRLDRSPGAVRVQIHRGLALLKRLLPPGLAVALVVPGRGLAAVRDAVLAEVASGRVVVFAGGVLVKKVAAVAALLVVCVLTAWSLLPGAGVRMPAGDEPVALPASASGSADGGAGTASREAVAAASGPATAASPRAARGSGELVVRVVAGAAREPQEGIEVDVVALQGSLERFATRAAPTDVRGEARFLGMPAGPVRVAVGVLSTLREAVVVAGAVTLVEVVIEGLGPFVLAGVVVDADAAIVPHAEIWRRVGLNEPSARFWLRADAQGRFRVRCAAHREMIAARAAGGRASPFLGVTPGVARADSELRLVVAANGADVAGIVRDANGAPVAGAYVQLCAVDVKQGSRRREDGCWDHELSTLRTLTNAAGEFAVFAASAGKTRLAVHSQHAGFVVQELVLTAGERKRLALVLAPGARVAGIVRDRNGAPVAGALLSAEDELAKHELWYLDEDRVASSDADGTYELACLPPGPAQLAVRCPGFRSSLHPGELVAGETLRWDPVLEANPTITGTVVDAGKRPIAECRIRAQCDSRGDEAVGDTVTDAQGRFTMSVRAGDAFRFRILEKGCAFEAPLAEPTGVRVGARDVVLVVPDAQRASSWLVGRVVGPDDALVAGVRIGITDGVWVPREFDKAKSDGSFRFGPLFAGDLWVALVPLARGAPEGRFGPFTLGPNQVLDVGTLQTGRPARLEVRAVRRGLGPVAQGSLELRYPGYPKVSCSSHLQLQDGRGALSLLAGEYALSAYGDDFMQRSQRIVLAAGERKTLDLELEPAIRPEVRFPVPEPPGWRGVARATVSLRRTDGVVVVDDDEADGLAGPNRRFYALGVGAYVLRLETPDRRIWEGSFEVRSLEPYQPAIEVAVREVR